MSSKEDEMLKALDEMEHAALNPLQQPTGGSAPNRSDTPSDKITKHNEEKSYKTTVDDNKTASLAVRFKQIGGHFHIDVHKAIALIGVTEDRTIQSLAAEAFEDLLRKRKCDQSILELTQLTRPTKK